MKKLVHTFFVATFLLSMLLIPQVVFADACDDLRAQLQNAGGGELLNQLPQYCTEGQVYQQLVTVLYGLIGIVAVLFVVYGGYLYMTAGGNDQQRKKGATVLKWAFIGVLVVLAAAVIVNIVVSLLVDNRIV